jgi:hypothetical protein
MSSLSGPKQNVRRSIKSTTFPLAIGAKVYRNWRAYADTTAGVVRAGVGTGSSWSANLVPVGTFDQDIDNTSGAATIPIQVTLDQEIQLQFVDSVTGGNAVTATNLFQDVYCFDNNTVTTSSSGSVSKAGRVWVVDATDGIGLQLYWEG